MADVSKLTSAFHNIEGVTIAERQKNLNRLLKNKWIINEEQTVLDDLKPKTYLESLFYVNTLIHFKQKSQLLELLKEGHETIVNRILKRKRFILDEMFENINANTLVNDLLPELSYVVKKKLLKRLCSVLPDNEMDKVFDLILERYGLFLATNVITGCSNKKIELILKYNEIQLRSKELILLYKKQPSLINIYANRPKMDLDEIFDNSFLTYVAQKDPAFFWELIDKHTFPNLKLGRRTTKKILIIKGHEIISDPKKYANYFRHETLVRKLNKLGHFKQFYYNIFPRDIEDLDEKSDSCNELLRYYPKRYRYDLFIQTFTDIIKDDICNNISCLENDLLQVVTDVTLRERLAQLKYEKYCDVEYFKYYETEKCFGLIKEQISVTSAIEERKKLLRILAESCAINKNLNTLEKVLQYFCERHRNDDKTVRTDFLQAIEVGFDEQQLQQAHWKYLKEIFTIQTLKKESGVTKLRINHIKFLHKSNAINEEIHAAIMEFLQNQVINGFREFKGLTTLKNPTIEKDIILAAMEFLSSAQTFITDEYRLYSAKAEVYLEICSYNKRYPEHLIAISTNDTLVELLRKILEDKYLYDPLLCYVQKDLCKLSRDEFDNEMLNIHLDNISADKNRIFQWYLKKDPKVILDNIEKFVASYSPTSWYSLKPTVWSKVKLYSHLDLDTKAVKCCLKQLESRDEDKISIIKLLSLLCSPEDYVKIIKDGNFIPTSYKVSLEDEKSQELYKFQQAFATNFRNLEDPLKFIDILIEKFCHGDYLHAALPPLYKAFFRSSENKLQIYLEKFSTIRSVSVKKHSVRLSQLFDQKTVLKILQHMEKDKINVSLQKHVFSSTLRYFSKNPNAEFFKITTTLFGRLKEHDIESLNLLLTVKIPNQYKHVYVKNIWNLLETFKDNVKFGDNGKFNASLILDLVDSECMQELPQKFCTEIIQKLFFKLDRKHSTKSGILPFVIKYLVYRSEMVSNYEFVFDILKKFKSKTWNKCNPKDRNTINTFFRTYYKMVCEKKLYQSITTFSRYWRDVFKPLETFDENILLYLLGLENSSDFELENYSRQIVLYAEEIYADFGQIVFPKFITVLSNHLKHTEKDTNDLFHAMLKYKSSKQNCVLIIELINRKGNLVYNEKIRPIYQDIDAILKDVSDPDVQLYYNLYFKNTYTNDLFYGMLKYKPCKQNNLLIIELTNGKGDLVHNAKIRPIYQDFDDILKDVSDPDVQLYYNVYYKQTFK